uniref:40S ribosomal protein S8 n=1 Tax=Mandrillus leucophaeus TaxID=9568 RepID=A0A2K6AAZ6_MANLE
MGISRDNWHKRHKTGDKRKPYHKKHKYELRCLAANTKIGPHRSHTVRARGECCSRKTRIIDVVYNASNNKLVCAKTLSHCVLPLGCKKGAKLTPEEEKTLNKKRSKKIQKKYDEREKKEKFQQGKPGQCGRAHGHVPEGKELELYLRKIKAPKDK